MIPDRAGGAARKEARHPGQRWTFLVLLLALVPGGCRLIGSGSAGPEAVHSEEPAIPLPAGVFDGFLEIEGGRIEGTLTITPAGKNEVEGVFEASQDLTAAGIGEVDGSDVDLELTYQGACPGGMRLRGSWTLESGRFSGLVRARDCTGEAEGTFLFQKKGDPIPSWNSRTRPSY